MIIYLSAPFFQDINDQEKGRRDVFGSYSINYIRNLVQVEKLDCQHRYKFQAESQRVQHSLKLKHSRLIMDPSEMMSFVVFVVF